MIQHTVPCSSLQRVIERSLPSFSNYDRPTAAAFDPLSYDRSSKLSNELLPLLLPAVTSLFMCAFQSVAIAFVLEQSGVLAMSGKNVRFCTE